jgi:hypothetical protein
LFQGYCCTVRAANVSQTLTTVLQPYMKNACMQLIVQKSIKGGNFLVFLSLLHFFGCCTLYYFTGT